MGGGGAGGGGGGGGGEDAGWVHVACECAPPCISD